MNYRNPLTRLVLSAATIAAFSAPASADNREWTEIDAEIRSCVATVGHHADYSDATRVRHSVVNVKERTVGYRLSIQTALYNDTEAESIREYATDCVINGSNVPMQFSISERIRG